MYAALSFPSLPNISHSFHLSLDKSTGGLILAIRWIVVGSLVSGLSVIKKFLQSHTICTTSERHHNVAYQKLGSSDLSIAENEVSQCKLQLNPTLTTGTVHMNEIIDTNEWNVWSECKY